MERPKMGMLRPEIENPEPASSLESIGIALLEAPIAFRDKINEWKQNPYLGRNIALTLATLALSVAIPILVPQVITQIPSNQNTPKENPVLYSERQGDRYEARYILPHSVVKGDGSSDWVALPAGSGITLPRLMIINTSNDLQLTVYPRRMLDLIEHPLSGIDKQADFAAMNFLVTVNTSEPIWELMDRELNNQFAGMQDNYRQLWELNHNRWSSWNIPVGNKIQTGYVLKYSLNSLDSALALDLLQNMRLESASTTGQDDPQEFSREFAQLVNSYRAIEINYARLDYLLKR